MNINIITIFPEFFRNATSYSILKRAGEKGIVKYNFINLREFTKDNYQTVDEHPYGGGAGMVMMIEPVYAALKSLENKGKVILPSAKGHTWNQKLALEFTQFSDLTFIIPHFEGIDERVTQNLVDYEVSIGNYVLSGGELPAMVMIDSVVRLLPDVLGNEESIVDESFSVNENGETFLEYPQYTRPSIFHTEEGEEWAVPEVLLSGNHEEIRKWRESMRKKINI